MIIFSKQETYKPSSLRDGGLNMFAPKKISEAIYDIPMYLMQSTDSMSDPFRKSGLGSGVCPSHMLNFIISS